jgi:hypothetical protein
VASVERDDSNVTGGYFDPHFKRTLWYLIAGMKGGANRAKILEVIKSQPANANQLATILEVDYKKWTTRRLSII